MRPRGKPLSVRQTAYKILDWFIPHAASIEPSEIGLARNFIATHLLGPVLIQSIVLLIYYTDPQPGLACWTMMGCVAAVWLLPFGFRVTQDLRLMALLSVELLSVTSLIGTSYYGGVNSPFLPWLLVSLMLGLFYLSDHALHVIALFAFNIVAVIGANLLHRFPQHISLQELSTISWFSVFSATTYMSVMAIYYAGIVNMQSKLERETERHRLLAQRLRRARQLADTASHGKAVFLTKMQRQFEGPLRNVAVACSRLAERIESGPTSRQWGGEIARIDAAGQRLLRLVVETVDLNRVALDAAVGTIDELELDGFMEQFISNAQPAAALTGHVLHLDKPDEIGSVRLDAGRLKQALESLLGRITVVASAGDVGFHARRYSDRGSDWVEFRIRTPRLKQATAPARRKMTKRSDAPASARQGDPELEDSQMHFAIIGGSFDVIQEPAGGMCYLVELPLPSSASLKSAA